MKKLSNWLMMLGVLMIILCLPIFLHAQGGPPNGGAGDPDAPIDGGVSLLLVAGIGYGVKKVRNYRKQKAKTEVL